MRKIENCGYTFEILFTSKGNGLRRSIEQDLAKFLKAWSSAAAKHRTFGPFGRLTIVDACKVPNKNFLAWAEMFEGQKVKCTYCQMFVEMHQNSYQHAV